MITNLAYDELRAKGVTMTQKPTEQPYGIEATCEDLYGNTFALVQPKQLNV